MAEFLFNDNSKLDLITHDKDYILSLASNVSELLLYASDELKKDKEFLKEVLYEDINSFKLLPLDIRNDLDFISLFYIENVSEIWSHDFESGNSKLSSYLGNKLLDNEELMIKLVNSDVGNFEYISERLKNDKKFIRKVVRFNINVLSFIDCETLNEKEREIILNDNIGALSFFDKERDMESWANKYVEKGFFDGLSYRFIDDEYYVKKALELNDYCIRNISERLKESKDFAQSILVKSPQLFYGFNQIIQDDFDCIKLVINSVSVLNFVSEDFIKSSKNLVKLLDMAEDKSNGNNELHLRTGFNNSTILKNEDINNIFTILYPNRDFNEVKANKDNLEYELLLYLRKNEMTKEIVNSNKKSKKVKF